MSNSQISVLVVFANPRGTSPLRLGTEDRVIRESIKLSRYRDNISLKTCPASTIHDLRRALLEDEFQIVHISGHGTDTGLVLEDELGGQYVVPQQALADLFQSYSPPLKCVILNACFSLSQGQLTSLGVPFTVAMEGSISDNAAIEFSRGFYDAIGAGRDIDFAYEEGCRTVKLAAPNTQFVSQILKDTTKLQVQDEFATIAKSDLVIRVERVVFIHEPKPLLWQNIEEKSRTVMKALYERVLHLGYTPDTFFCCDEDSTIVQYRAIPPQYFQELKKAVDTILCEYLVTVTWRENKNIGFNLSIRLGKDIGR